MSGIMRTFPEAGVFRSLKRVISIEMDRTLVLFSNPSVRGKLANMWKRLLYVYNLDRKRDIVTPRKTIISTGILKRRDLLFCPSKETL